MKIITLLTAIFLLTFPSFSGCGLYDWYFENDLEYFQNTENLKKSIKENTLDKLESVLSKNQDAPINIDDCELDLMSKACDHLYPNIVKFVLTKGFNPNTILKNGDSPLHKVVAGIFPYHTETEISRALEVISALIQHGAEIDSLNSDNNTPLVLASNSNKKVPILKYLLKKGANANAHGRNGTTPLLESAASKNLTGLKLLIDSGANIEGANELGATPLIEMANKGNLFLVEYFLKLGANINAKDTFGATPLIWAAFRNHVAVVKKLLSEGASLNEKTVKAIYFKKERSPFDLMLNYPQQYDIVASGYSALSIAKKYDSVQAAMLLEEAGAKETEDL